MQIHFRVTSGTEIDLITHLRIDFVRDLHPEFDEQQIAILSDKTREYLQNAYRSDSFIGIIGEVADEAVCCAGILCYDLPPISDEIRKTGHILNFFTYPLYRRRGYARKMMSFIIAHAKQEGFERLFLNACPMAEGLYRQFGFSEQSEKALVLKL